MHQTTFQPMTLADIQEAKRRLEYSARAVTSHDALVKEIAYRALFTLEAKLEEEKKSKKMGKLYE